MESKIIISPTFSFRGIILEEFPRVKIEVKKMKKETKNNFAGDKKFGKWIFSDLENRLVEKTIHLIPKWLETYHLTMMTLLWSVVIVLAGYLAEENINWFWLVSAMIVAQYITDLYDGKIGRLRNTGLVKWGYFMDHFLDYVFLCSILIAYSFLVPNEFRLLGLFTVMVIIGFMINFFLFFATTNRFKISHLGIGPTESRLIFIIANTLLIIFGAKYFLIALPFIGAVASLALVIVIWQSHKETWKMDMENKKKNG